jgi:predicted DNA-binding transcriptional regulator AlpA
LCARSAIREQKDADVTTKTITTKRPPAAQVEPAKKAAALKAASEAKKVQPLWLQPKSLAPTEVETTLNPERIRASDRSQGPPRLLDKAEVCAIANVSFPTIWAWQRKGTFPRSRIVGGKSMWLSTEIEQWLASLPVRTLKGDGA